MKKFLLFVFFGGDLIIIISLVQRGINVTIVSMLSLLLFSSVFIFMFIWVFENPKEAIDKLNERFIRGNFYRTEKARESAVHKHYNSARKHLPVMFGLLVLIYLSLFIARLVSVKKSGCFSCASFTFILGVIIIALMSIIILINKFVCKEPFLDEKNIRRNAYIFLNILLSLLMIAR